jgi:hypothetical protein
MTFPVDILRDRQGNGLPGALGILNSKAAGID